ncbi:MAG: hypothetical protein ACTSPK_14765, partial [Candidatus Heimdallarchaeota archaeon]
SEANNYSVYRSSSFITEIDGSLTLLADEITDLTLALTGYEDGTYYFIVVAHNNHGDTLSNCIEVNVELPAPPGDFTLSSNAGDPDTDGIFDLTWTAASEANNYSVYRSSSFITEIDGSLTLLADEITDLTLALTGMQENLILMASSISHGQRHLWQIITRYIVLLVSLQRLMEVSPSWEMKLPI